MSVHSVPQAERMKLAPVCVECVCRAREENEPMEFGGGFVKGRLVKDMDEAMRLSQQEHDELKKERPS